MKKITFSLAFCGLLSFSMTAQNRIPVTSSPVSSQNPIVVPSGFACEGVLLNYTNSILDDAGGVTSQDFETANDIYDGMAADDFMPPGSGLSTICTVAISGTGSGLLSDPASQIILRIFEDDGGMPGAIISTESFPGAVDTDSDGSFVLIPTGPELMGGTTYWLSVQVAMDFNLGAQWYWNTASDGNGEIYVWQNPGNGFGNGCVAWSPHTSCGLPGVADLMMDISFNSVLGVNANSFEDSVSIFPNPANNEFTLRSNVSLKELKIYDLKGSLVKTMDLSEMSNEKRVEISSLSSGTYLVQITGDKGTVIKNLVKQ